MAGDIQSTVDPDLKVHAYLAKPVQARKFHADVKRLAKGQDWNEPLGGKGRSAALEQLEPCVLSLFASWDSPDEKQIDSAGDDAKEYARQLLSDEESDDIELLETLGDEPTELTPEVIATGILDPTTNRDRLRDLICTAEDCQFEVDQQYDLAVRLRDIACQWRESNNAADEAAVWSAVRTGISMLTPDKADVVLPLLDRGHRIPTMLVALKMVARLFTAQPPKDLDEHGRLAKRVQEIAEGFTHPDVLAAGENAATAQFAIEALFAMGFSGARANLGRLEHMQSNWSHDMLRRRLNSLAHCWGESGYDAGEFAPLENVMTGIHDLGALSQGNRADAHAGGTSNR